MHVFFFSNYVVRMKVTRENLYKKKKNVKELFQNFMYKKKTELHEKNYMLFSQQIFKI